MIVMSKSAILHLPAPIRKTENVKVHCLKNLKSRILKLKTKENKLMTKKLHLLPSALLLSATVLSANVANADGALDGLYISGKIGSSSLNHTIERNIGNSTLPVQDTSGVSSVRNSDISLGIAIGYTLDVTSDFFVGVEGFYTYENNNTRNINSVLITDIELDQTYGGRLLAGAHVTDKFSVYAHGGITVLDFDIANSYTFAPPTRAASTTEAAFAYGIGADYKLNENISVFLEYTQINDVDFTPIGEVAGDTGRINPNDLDLNTTSIGFKYNF